MPNENEEVLEAEEVEETEAKAEETETEADKQTEGEKENKPSESLEDRKARLERQLAQTNKKLGVDVSKPEKKSSKTDDFGYDVKAYLKTSGIQANEFDFVKNEMKSSGLKDVDALLENNYFKSRLESLRALNKTAEATPSGKRSGGVAVDDVNYWMGKPIEDVPADMRVKVVNAKLAKEKNKGMFYNS